MEKTENNEKLEVQRAFCPMGYKSADKCGYLCGNECRVQWAPVDSAEGRQCETADENYVSWKICCFK